MVKEEKYLPIGSVCLLKDATKKVMVTGFCVKSDETSEKIYDYIGCMYPEGVLSSTQNLLFDHEQIETIYYLGFINEEEKKFKELVNEAMNKVVLDNVESLDDTTPEPREDFSKEELDSPVAMFVTEEN